MAQASHTKAAEHHETAAKSHRAAADSHGKGDHAKAGHDAGRHAIAGAIASCAAGHYIPKLHDQRFGRDIYGDNDHRPCPSDRCKYVQSSKTEDQAWRLPPFSSRQRHWRVRSQAR